MDLEYDAWMAEVEELVYDRAGLHLEGLPVTTSRGAFEEGMTPEEYVESDIASIVAEELGEDIADLLGEG